MRCLVTGGAGFIGSHLVELLLKEGHHVLALDNLVGGSLQNIEEFEQNPNFCFVKADIRNKEELSPHFKNIDWVFHLAALADIVPSIENPKDYYDTNVTGTFNVLQASKQSKVKRFVYTASSSCYGLATQFPTPESAPALPQYPYALTKYLGEQLAVHWHQVYNLPVVSLRLFNVYGPRSRTSGTYGAVFGVFLAQKIHGKPYTVVGDGTQTRDFTYVTDVARAFYRAAEAEIKFGVFNVGSGGHYSVNRLIQLLQGDKVHIPKRPGEPECTFADTQKIKNQLNWQPKVSFEEGVQQILNHIDYWKKAPLWEPKNIKKATESWFQYLEG
ncbi:MAG: UDP-glucose 4-epimerase [Chlamydiae bacterium]|nr:UDP-glucose 4-epimerase [Chlamydiota bacterium]